MQDNFMFKIIFCESKIEIANYLFIHSRGQRNYGRCFLIVGVLDGQCQGTPQRFKYVGIEKGIYQSIKRDGKLSLLTFCGKSERKKL